MAKVGRPARISREAIAEAATEVGLSDLTLRAVADHLGVSIASLYHHVDSKDDLLRLAAEHSMRRTPLPHDRGQHWAVWLLEWAHYNRDVFAADPALLAQYVEGGVDPEVVAENTERILTPLVRQGFSASEALAAYWLVSSCALGTAVNVIRDRRLNDAGQPSGAVIARLVHEQGPEAFPHLSRLLDELRDGPVDDFDERVASVLAGIAVRRGDDWRAVVAELDASGT